MRQNESLVTFVWVELKARMITEQTDRKAREEPFWDHQEESTSKLDHRKERHLICIIILLLCCRVRPFVSWWHWRQRQTINKCEAEGIGFPQGVSIIFSTKVQ